MDINTGRNTEGIVTKTSGTGSTKHHTILIFSTFKEIKDKLENTCGEHKTIKNKKAPITRDK